jgi:phosphoribosylaminoimidazole (AIR) synthetase
MGIGMVILVAPDQADAVLRFARAQNHSAWPIGQVAKGRGVVRVV